MQILNFILLFLIIAVINGLLNSTNTRDINVPFKIKMLWNNYKKNFGKKYTQIKHEIERKNIFRRNVNRIQQHNKEAKKGLYSYRLSVNKFADMSTKEWVVYNGLRGFKINKSKKNLYVAKRGKTPAKVDWRKRGVVTSVKNQGIICQSCWAFAVVAAIESQLAIKKKKKINLSEQHLIDCDRSNHGCLGGQLEKGYQYIIRHGGIAREKYYKYKNFTPYKRTCKYNSTMRGARIKGFSYIEYGNERMLKQAVANVGPISAGIDTGSTGYTSFQMKHYHSGIYDNKFCSSTKIDHAITIVGYGREKHRDYWIVKNTWGKKWGEKGYIRMARNKKNQCGIANAACFPTGVH